MKVILATDGSRHAEEAAWTSIAKHVTEPDAAVGVAQCLKIAACSAHGLHRQVQRLITSAMSFRNFFMSAVLGRLERNCLLNISLVIARRLSACDGRRSGLSQGRLLRSVKSDLEMSQEHSSTKVYIH